MVTVLVFYFLIDLLLRSSKPLSNFYPNIDIDISSSAKLCDLKGS